MARVADDATAFAHRTRKYFVAVLGLWQDPTEDGASHRAWAESLWQAIRHERASVYVNFLENEGEDRIHEAYPAAIYTRLAAIKQQYDPENIFHHNQNIRPAR
jgi:FAD/FMN-containing dehydrogenase